MAEVLHGNASANQLNATANRTQVYGLAGNDTLTSDGKSNVLLVGGSGSDSLVMSGGNGTLSGGAGADTFELNYSASQTLSAVIEDVEPSSDKIVVNFNGTATPTLSSVASGSDVVLSDSAGRLAVTLKGVRENDYFDGTASDEAWEVLKLTNDERETQSLSPLTMSDGLTAGASVRAQEITESFSHTRPDGTDCFTVLEKSYSANAENIAEGQNSPASVVSAWMNSTGHRTNILNSDYQKLGVGYVYEDTLDYEHYWVQLFGSTLTSPKTVSTSNLLTTPIEVNTVASDSKVIQLANGGATYDNTVEGATIIGGTGNDSILNNAKNVSINGSTGNDTLENFYLSNVTINGGAGNDSIHNVASFVTIDGGGDDDFVIVGRAVSVSDTIYSRYVSVNGGIGNDSIRNNGNANVTISGNVGDDLIQLATADAESNVLQYASGDGNDSIVGFNDTSTLQIGGGTGTYSTQVSGSDVIVSVGTGSILLQGAASLSAINIAGVESTPTALNITNTANNTLITGTELADTIYNNGIGVTIAALGDNDSISNTGNSASILGGANDDTIYNSASYTTIDGGAGNDSIYYNGPDTGELTNVSIAGGEGSDTVYNRSGDSVIIQGDSGNDLIHNWEGYYATLLGGTGADTVINESSQSVTINAGAGNDIVSLASNAYDNLIQYASGDGNDTVSGLNSTSTLQIGGGTGTYSTQVSGSDVIVSVGTGSILLTGAASLGSSLNIAGTNNTDTTPANPLLITLTEGDDTYSNTLDGATIAALGSNDSIDNYAANVSISGAAGNDSINNHTSSNVTIDGGAGDDSIGGYDPRLSINGGTGNDYINIGFHPGDAPVLSDNSTLTGGDGNDTIFNVGGSSVSIDGGAGDDYIDSHVVLGDDTEYGINNTINGGAGNDTIGNRGANSTITGGTGHDSISLASNAYDNLIRYASGDGNDTVYNFNADDTLQIGGGTGTYSTQVSGGDIIVSVGDGSILLQGAASLGSSLNIAGEEVATVDPLNIVGTEGADNISNSLAGATIAALGGNDTVENTGARVSVSGGADNDSIKNSGARSTLLGDAGNDRIENSGVLSTILGGRSNDAISLSSDGANSYIQYEPGDGNDTIWGKDTNTTLRIVAETASSINTGDDIVISVGEGSIRLVGARIRPPHVVLGASGSSGGTSSSGGSGSSASGSGSSGGSGGGSSSGGSSSGGSSGNGSSGSGFSSKRSRFRTSSSNSGSSSSGNISNTSSSSGSSGGGRVTSSMNLAEVMNALMSETQQTTETQPTTNQRVYSGGNQIISDYQSGEKIIFAEIYTGSFYDAEGNYCVGSSTGALVIQNAPDKVIDLQDVAGNDFLKAYSATTAGVIDGRGLAGFELINGSAGADAIFAGDGGSQQWGGADVAVDTLVGGNGTDIFIGGKNQGADIFLNASSADIVHLNDATLSDIIATEENNGAIAIAFNTGNVVGVQSSEALSATVMLADGAAY